MNKTLILEEIKNDITSLKDQKLKEVFDFIKFIKNREEIDPTIELLENKKFYNSVKKGVRQKAKGKVLDWNKVK